MRTYWTRWEVQSTCIYEAVDTARPYFLARYSKDCFLYKVCLYEVGVMPMGLMNAPATFMHTMNNPFSDMLDSGMAVFLE